MKSALKSAGLPQAKDKTVNAISNFNDTKSKTSGSLNNYQQVAGVLSGGE